MKKILLSLICIASIMSVKAQTVITIGSGTNTSGASESSPINIYFRSHHCRILYTPAELNAAGWNGPSTITKLGFNIFGSTTEALPNFNIGLKNTSADGTAIYDYSGIVNVYNNSSYLPTIGGFELLTLNTPFNWDGTSNLLIDVCFDPVSSWSESGQVYTYSYTASNPQYASVREDNSSQCGVATQITNPTGKPQLQLEMNPLSACTGSPLPGTAVVTNACASVSSLTLSLENGSVASGTNYQWQESQDLSSWSNIGTSQIDHHYIITSLSARTYFRCVSTCTNGGSSSTSSSILVHPNTHMNCYCKPSWPNYMVDCTQDKIADFSLSNIISQTTNCDAYGYSDSTGSINTQINLQQGLGYNLSVNTIVSGLNGDAFTGVWIDFNQNGSFDSEEYTALGYGQSGNYQNSINIPLNAGIGITRMRLAMDAYNAYSGTILSPCSNNTGALGQILDYRVNIYPPAPCSGTPNTGTAVSTESLVCAGVSYTLDLTGNEISSGLTYQWFSSPDNATWSPVGSSSTTFSLPISSQTITTYYQCVSTCTVSTLSSTSTPVTVTQNLQINCNCIPAYISCDFGDSFTQVDFAGITDSPVCNAGNNGYEDRTGIASTATVTAGSTYTINMNFGNSSNGPAFISAWIDENQNGIFENNEHRVLGSSVSSPYSQTITIPFTATGGLTRMRLKLETTWAGSLNQDACLSNGTYGENVDYYLSIIPAPICSGSPNAGDATSNTMNVCTNEPFTLDLTNNGQNGGLLFQWQKSKDGANWLNYGPLQATVPLPTPGQSETTQYRCLVTCTASALTSTSTPVTVTQNAFTVCYCVPQAFDCNNNYITNVSFETINDSPTCATSVNGYNDNTSLVSPPSISAGQNYTISVGMSQQFGESFAAIWIDYNQNGIFETNEEQNIIGSIITSDTITGTINVPYTAIGGSTRMRVKMEHVGFSNFGGFNPCLNDQSEGQTIDYLVNINPSPACSGPTAPDAGNTDASATAVCNNDPITLTLINNDHLSNMNYQWQSSIDNTNWINMGNPQTMVPYGVYNQTVTTYYRCIVTCLTNSLTSISSAVTVIQNPVTLCYCTPPTADCSLGDEINNVVFATLSNTSTCSTDGFVNYAASVPSATVQAGQTYSINVVVGSDYYGKVSAWIDHDQNGIFEYNEYTNLGVTNSTGNYTVSSNIYIPASATPGITKMRIRNNRDVMFADNEACADGFMPGRLMKTTTGSQGRGETEDYSITILPPDCNTTSFPSSVAVTGSLTICPGGSTVLDLGSGIPVATGITYQWKYFNGTVYTNVGAPAAISSYTAFPAGNTSYFCEILCNGNPVRNSDTVMVNVHNITTAPTITDVSCFGSCNGSIVLNASSFGSTLTYSWAPTGGTTGTATNLCAAIYTVNILNSTGCTITETLVVNGPMALSATATSTNITCFGNANGQAQVVVAGGTGSYTYNWNSGSNSSLATSLIAGTHTCIITDANFCTATQTVTIIEPSALTATTSQSNVTCFGGNDGFATINPIGGTAPYLYSWSPGGSINQTANNLSAQGYTCIVTDVNNCTTSQFVTLSQGSQILLGIGGNNNLCENATANFSAFATNAVGAVTYTWVSLPGTILSNSASFDYTATTVGSHTLQFSVTDANGCSETSMPFVVNVNASTNISGIVLTASTSVPVSGNVILYKYEPFFTKFDSISSLTLNASGNYTFTSVPVGTYIVKAVPSASSLQITYGNSEVNWKTANQIFHGCVANAVQNIDVIPIEVLPTTGSGFIRGHVYKDPSYGHKPNTFHGDPFKTMGLPLKGAIVKGGRNPGASTFIQTTTGIDGGYAFDNLPNTGADTSYFVLVDIPGLDTNHTYHVIITDLSNQYSGLDFVVDSIQITPVTNVKVKEIDAKDFNLNVYPNPTNSVLNINFNLKTESNIRIKLYDIIGNEVKNVISDNTFPSGSYNFKTDMIELANGIYFVKLNINEREITLKVVKDY